MCAAMGYTVKYIFAKMYKKRLFRYYPAYRAGEAVSIIVSLSPGKRRENLGQIFSVLVSASLSLHWNVELVAVVVDKGSIWKEKRKEKRQLDRRNDRYLPNRRIYETF